MLTGHAVGMSYWGAVELYAEVGIEVRDRKSRNAWPQLFLGSRSFT